MEPEPATDGLLSPGTNLNGTYEIVRRLFEGGMADIYEARHVRLTGRYAIKVLRHSLTAQHASAFDRFRREAEVTSSLRHPNIVQVLDYNQTATGAAYFVMELLEGENLRQHLDARRALPLAEVAAIVEQVASALAAAHARGIVHRDLKPENIHLLPVAGRKEPFVKVLDFGISKVLAASTLTQEAMLVGTPHYMAPEQARGGSDDLDGRTDQFALGAIAHELLTGRRLFDAEAVYAIIYRVLSDDPPSLAPIAGETVDAVIRRALAKDRKDRHASVALFAEALRDAVFGPPRTSVPVLAASGGLGSGSAPQPIPATASSGATGSPTLGAVAPPIAPLTRPPRRRLAAVAALLVLAAGAAGIVWKRQTGPTWSPGSARAVAAGADLEATLRRLLVSEATELADTAARAGKIPSLVNAVVGRVDDTTFQDLLANEVWWSDFRAFGCVVLARNEVKVTWHLPPVGLSPSEIENALRPAISGAAAPATLVSGPAGTVQATAAPIDGLKQGRIILLRAIDRNRVAAMAARMNTVLLLSDGKKTLGASVPDGTMPEIDRLVGQEATHVLVDNRHERLATAVPWANGLWLWIVTGWAP